MCAACWNASRISAKASRGSWKSKSEIFPTREGAIRIVEEAEQCQLDIFTRMTGLHYADIAGDAVRSSIEGREILHASKAALIRLKSGSVREKDRIDVAALRSLEQNPHAFD